MLASAPLGTAEQAVDPSPKYPKYGAEAGWLCGLTPMRPVGGSSTRGGGIALYCWTGREPPDIVAGHAAWREGIATWCSCILRRRKGEGDGNDLDDAAEVAFRGDEGLCHGGVVCFADLGAERGAVRA